MTSIAARSNTSTQSVLAAPASLDALRGSLAGTLVLPGDPGYDEARQVLSLAYDRYPAVIVRVGGTSDVALAVAFARAQGLPLAVRSGGHSVMGHSSIDDALVVDLGGMRRISIDPITRVATVDAGVTSEELGATAGAFGLALTTGDTSSVGIGGLAVGGGIGWMARRYGLTIDSMLAATVVTADGDVVQASEMEHPDLFWALRGGGGNFGIVTDFTFRLAPNGNVQGGAVVLPATREVLRGYLDYAADAPRDLTTIAFLMQAPPAPFIPEASVGELVLLVAACYTGPAEEVDDALAPIRNLAQPIADTVEAIPYPAMFAFTAEATKRHGAAIRSLFAQEISDDQVDAMLASMSAPSSPFNMVQLRGLGGAIADVPAEATAFANRDARLMATVLGIWYDPTDDGVAHRDWTSNLFEILAPASRGAYVNFLQDDGVARQREAYPARVLERLQEVKRRYDPENVFQFNQNIRPAR